MFAIDTSFLDERLKIIPKELWHGDPQIKMTNGYLSLTTQGTLWSPEIIIKNKKKKKTKKKNAFYADDKENVLWRDCQRIWFELIEGNEVADNYIVPSKQN